MELIPRKKGKEKEKKNKGLPGRFSGWSQYIPSPSSVGMNSSINMCGIKFPAPHFAAKCSKTSASDGSNFTPAGRPGHSEETCKS